MEKINKDITFTVNKDGFTFWYQNIIILADMPFERMKEDKELAYQTLETIHQIMMRGQEYK